MRRITFAWVVVAAPITGGSTCFVGVPECSETPCVEFVGGAQSTVLVSPGVGPLRPTAGCPRGARRSRSRSGPTAVPSPVVAPQPIAVPALGAVLQAAAARLAHRLTHRAASAGP